MIKLPARLDEKLNQKPSLYADTRKTLDLFEPWLEQSGMPFFPGFTDHSPRHINDVLNTASSLISDLSHSLLSPEDVSALVISILLHDCGMHLTQDGFRALISSDKPPPISGLGDRAWPQLWKEFLAEARRFGEERLVAVFGDAQPLSVDNIDLSNLSERDCLLIGEFVRRHHARLAHEISLLGVPTLGNQKLAIVGLDEDIKDLAGLIARSHGMAIRQTFDYLNLKYNRISEYRGIKATYLMAVLRIADYVQVQSERALHTLLSVKELRSPISRQEWRNHFAVNDVTMRHEDPEAMFVHAAPKDVKTFLRLDGLFKDIQKELDHSWATIGEVYGRMGDLANLGLTVRRVRSNLENVKQFSKTVTYIPVNSGFKSSGPELLKLLVGPLYSYDYGVAIRELLQNSVDACKELADISIDMESAPEVKIEIQEAEDGTGWVIVTDTGVGMTLRTVTEYFLVAGASFRNSDLWKKEHTDIDGKSRILRGGRFGVGALAAFMLGDEIHVTTRHFANAEVEGLTFSARMDEPVVELRRCSAPRGTEIKIWVGNSEVLKSLRPDSHLHATDLDSDGNFEVTDWRKVDWFAQTEPKASFYWTGFANKDWNDEAKIPARTVFFPRSSLVPFEPPYLDWHILPNVENYRTVLWQFPKPETKTDGERTYTLKARRNAVVNGIRVQSIDENLNFPSETEGPNFSIKRPSLAIFDPAGICPINLQRSEISFARMGIDEKIAIDVIAQFWKQVLQIKPAKLSLSDFNEFSSNILKLDGVRFSSDLSPLAVTNNGIFLMSPRFFRSLNVKTTYFVDAFECADILFSNVLKEGEAICFRNGRLDGEQNQLAWLRAMHGQASTRWQSEYRGFPDLDSISEYGYVDPAVWTLANTKGKVRKSILENLSTRDEDIRARFVFDRDKVVSSSEIARLNELFEAFEGKSHLTVWQLGAGELPHAENKSSLLVEGWLSEIGGPLLSI